MKTVFRVDLATLALLVLWAVVVFVETSEGWWRQTLAPRGDTAGFMDAAANLVDSSNMGNAVFVVIDDGSVHGVHAVSVGEAVHVNTVFQTASLSKWIRHGFPQKSDVQPTSQGMTAPPRLASTKSMPAIRVASAPQRCVKSANVGGKTAASPKPARPAPIEIVSNP
jgi:hypothetical protein